MSRLIGSLRRLDAHRGAVRMEDVYDTDIDDLWSALTQPDRVARWIAEVDGELREGGAIRASFTSSWEGPARIEVCTAPNHLIVTLDPGTDDASVIEAVLTPEGDQTRLVIDVDGLPLNNLHFYGAGWQAHLDDLTRYLAGAESQWQAGWEQLTPSYQALTVL